MSFINLDVNSFKKDRFFCVQKVLNGKKNPDKRGLILLDLPGEEEMYEQYYQKCQ